MNASLAIIEAIASLSEASGFLGSLDKDDLAHRCANAASQLQLVALEALEMADDEGDR